MKDELTELDEILLKDPRTNSDLRLYYCYNVQVCADISFVTSNDVTSDESAYL